jgi:hypothetical protein
LEDFLSLTPVQVFKIIEVKNLIDTNHYDFFRHEFRTQNYFIIKSSMSETNHIQSPSDLYRLDIDKIIEDRQQQKMKSVKYDKDFESWANDYLKG